MKTKLVIVTALFLLLARPASLSAGHRLLINLSLYSGSTAAQANDAQVIASYNLTPIFQGPLEIEPAADSGRAEIAQLEKAFNIPRIFLVSHDQLLWDSAAAADVEKFVMMGGSEYRIALTPVSLNGSYKFRVEVAVKEKTPAKSKIVDSEIVLTARQPVVIGFRGEPRDDMRHFISLRVVKASETPESAATMLSPEKRPKLIRKVAPVYPKEALDKKLQGVVIVEATTNERGEVAAVKFLSDTDPVLNEAAGTAVKQWVFSPYLVNDKPRPVSFTVTITFKLNPDEKPAALKLPPEKRPEIIKKVNPVYPETARKSGVTGKVVLEATIDEKGQVTSVNVLEGAAPELNEAAVDAVRQWAYKPYLLEGKPQKVEFTVTVNFALDKKK